MKVLIYTRVSTRNKQDIDNQLIKLHEYCKKSGYQVYREVIDKDSGSKSDRPGFREIFDLAAKRKYGLLLFWSLDRFSREGAYHTINYLRQLEDLGIGFKSLTEPYIDSSGIFKDVIIALLATLAKQEKQRISERVKAGLDNARLNGRVGGRPTITEGVITEIKGLKAEGMSYRKIASRLKVSRNTVKKYV
ncbi:MAG: resolvase [Bacteroidetes bacterium]|nr:MAG: resolvase [Bacteroidota bacterium]